MNKKEYIKFVKILGDIGVSMDLLKTVAPDEVINDIGNVWRALADLAFSFNCITFDQNIKEEDKEC